MDKIEIYNVKEDEVDDATGFASGHGGCTICGGICVGDYPICAEGRIGEGEDTEVISVCDLCMKVGQWDAILERHADDLEHRAKYLRGLIGKLVVMPDDQAWRDACEAYTTENRRKYLQRLNEQGFN
ncbi:MAG: hypothetical protein ACLQF4_08485 [Xanthobacteraceae bacterium]